MANIVPYSFPVELLSGTHQFQSGGNSFYLSLYTANPYTTASTAYSATSEVSSGGGSQYPCWWKFTCQSSSFKRK
jgi:hypothetical protein